MKKLTQTAAGVALVVAMGPASAVLLQPGLNLLEDDNLDFFYTVGDAGLVPAVGKQQIDEGDVLISFVEYQSYNGTPTEDLGIELTGIAVIERGAITSPTTFDFVPYSGGFNQALIDIGLTAADGDITVTGGEAGGGAMFAIWEGTLGQGLDLDINSDNIVSASGFSCSTILTCAQQTVDGVIWEVDGIAHADDFWGANSDDLGGGLRVTDPQQILNGSPSQAFVSFNAGLSVLDPGASNASQNREIDADPTAGERLVDVLLTGDVKGGGAADDWGNAAQRTSLVGDGFVATSDGDLSKVGRTPVPGALALLGAGLLGLGLTRRRRS